MVDLEDIEQIRKFLNSDQVRIARVADEARVKPTTLYSFACGDTTTLRFDTLEKLRKALRRLFPENTRDLELEAILDEWGSISVSKRKILAETARALSRNES
ncbi:MAG: hypothetical protein AAF292_16310 [Pseudomonadota bacterium]